jgi:hypothetical protein
MKRLRLCMSHEPVHPATVNTLRSWHQHITTRGGWQANGDESTTREPGCKTGEGAEPPMAGMPWYRPQGAAGQSDVPGLARSPRSVACRA